MKKFNINDFVKVKLTDRGKDIYYHRFDKLNYQGRVWIEPSYPEVDENGYTEIQLWDFMSIFGPHLYNGCNIVIERNEIFMYDKSLEDCAI